MGDIPLYETIAIWIANFGIWSQSELGRGFVKLTSLHHSGTPFSSENRKRVRPEGASSSLPRGEGGSARKILLVGHCFLNWLQNPRIRSVIRFLNSTTRRNNPFGLFFQILNL